MLIYKIASKMIERKQTIAFSRLIHESCVFTDWINKDYPKHLETFYKKYIPGIFSNTREIVACYDDADMVAVIFLKKSPREQKISTLYVEPGYQGKGIANNLLKMSFDWLGTTKPLISIADYKLPQFAGIIERYGWEEKQILSDGYYNSHSREHVFNGIIN